MARTGSPKFDLSQAEVARIGKFAAGTIIAGALSILGYSIQQHDWDEWDWMLVPVGLAITYAAQLFVRDTQPPPKPCPPTPPKESR